jgi:hypothetical protein
MSSQHTLGSVVHPIVRERPALYRVADENRPGGVVIAANVIACSDSSTTARNRPTCSAIERHSPVPHHDRRSCRLEYRNEAGSSCPKRLSFGHIHSKWAIVNCSVGGIVAGSLSDRRSHRPVITATIGAALAGCTRLSRVSFPLARETP